ncbi:GNAT family N-acetyltransferase [Pendulispora albinea]|uniref:GNAT family N-acetyltransferase n=1 Tax=Pendulispora albinea TaxID=2741071 RepID=A0ABZ2MBV7_9BACT
MAPLAPWRFLSAPIADDSWRCLSPTPPAVRTARPWRCLVPYAAAETDRLRHGARQWNHVDIVYIRDIEPKDFPLLLRINNDHAMEVNELTRERLEELVGLSARARVVDAGLGFLLAFDQTTPVQGPNHAWFLEREPAFFYIDRVVVVPEARGRGLARRLYEDLAAAGDRVLCAEVNLEPPNHPGLAFHERLGFVPCGEGVDPRNGKRVCYLRQAAARSRANP